VFRRFSQPKKDRYIRNHYTAAASDWLRDRVVGKVVLHEGHHIAATTAIDGAIVATISDGVQVRADQIITATGYSVDVDRLSMLHPNLLAKIQRDSGAPLLNARFESSVAGLYFVGLTSLRSFGPLFRFVVGCKAAAQRVAGAIAQQQRAARSRAS
jgi:hypothetical protein